MYKFFRIFFTILSAISVASAILLGIFLDFIYFIIAVALAIFFFGLCLLFKQLHERQENSKTPPPSDNFADQTTNLKETTQQIELEILSLQQNQTQSKIENTENQNSQLPISSEKQDDSLNHP